MGVQEYFFYEPDDSPYWRRTQCRLLGWQFDTTGGAILEMTPDQHGRLWSVHLDSLLVPDGMYLRLYDRSGQQRLTEAEAVTRETEALTRETEVLTRETEALRQKLRSLGVNPDEIENT